MSNALQIHGGSPTVNQDRWLQELSKYCEFVVNFIEIILNIFMMPTGRSELYFRNLVDIINFHE